MKKGTTGNLTIGYELGSKYLKYNSISKSVLKNIPNLCVDYNLARIYAFAGLKCLFSSFILYYRGFR
jgi:hypothetical protein